MHKAKIELWRIHNHLPGYGLLSEPKHDVQEVICEFVNKNDVIYCFHKEEYSETPYTDGRYVKSGPWGRGYRWKESHKYFAGCELQPNKIEKPWKFGDFAKYVIIYYQEKNNA